MLGSSVVTQFNDFPGSCWQCIQRHQAIIRKKAKRGSPRQHHCAVVFLRLSGRFGDPTVVGVSRQRRIWLAAWFWLSLSSQIIRCIPICFLFHFHFSEYWCSLFFPRRQPECTHHVVTNTVNLDRFYNSALLFEVHIHLSQLLGCTGFRCGADGVQLAVDMGIIWTSIYIHLSATGPGIGAIPDAGAALSWCMHEWMDFSFFLSSMRRRWTTSGGFGQSWNLIVH